MNFNGGEAYLRGDFVELLRFCADNDILAGFITNKAEILSDKICQSIQVLLDAPKTLKSVCNILSE